jgi:hypothetical protein
MENWFFKGVFSARKGLLGYKKNGVARHPVTGACNPVQFLFN